MKDSFNKLLNMTERFQCFLFWETIAETVMDYLLSIKSFSSISFIRHGRQIVD